jgi:adenylyltransferase/sulfurtransferase
LQTQEALKLIHGLPVVAGQALVYNGEANRFYATRFQRREECLSHETYPEPRELNLSATRHTAADVFLALDLAGAKDQARLELDRDLVVSLTCAPCGWHRPLMRPLYLVGIEAARCEHCGQMAKPRLEHTIEAGSALAGERLSALGIPPFDILRIEAGKSQFTALLAGDRSAVLM